MSSGATGRALRELAVRCGVQLEYTAGDGRRVSARSDTLLAILQALGHPVEDAAGIETELASVRHRRATQVLEPALVMDRAGIVNAPAVLPGSVDPASVALTVRTESGLTHSFSLADLSAPAGLIGDERRSAYSLDLGALDLEVGYHRLRLDGPGISAGALLLARPPALDTRRRDFGVIAPLYAIRGADDWGVGSYRDLAAFAGWVRECGGGVAGTLPLFAGALRAPVDPSPYLPYSRLYWNELYVDVAALPEANAPGARTLISSEGFQRELEKLAAEPEVDYSAAIDRKREALMVCATELVGSDSPRRAQFQAFIDADPDLTRYAEFRAADDLASNRWHFWPSSPGHLPAAAIEPQTIEYHCFVQFAAAEQLGAAATAGADLYLDLPVGVHPDGYDTWAYSDIFADAGVGAPPDELGPQGQSWGFPPMHPQRLRDSGYEYLIRAYREVFKYARAIRIDHVLGLHRTFWIPSGRDATEGVYVRYPYDELSAVIAIEAQRAGALVIGEDLGTVTPAIRRAMDRDGMLHSFVTRFEADAEHPLPQPRRPSAASLGTHDLPKFAPYWDETGPVGDEDPRAGMASGDALEASLYSLAEGPAELVLVDLGDLLGERVPDNRPGTGPEAGNWRHRLPGPLSELGADPTVGRVLEGIKERRAALPDPVPATEGGRA